MRCLDVVHSIVNSVNVFTDFIIIIIIIKNNINQSFRRKFFVYLNNERHWMGEE